ncbi:uncharacterized protein LOC116120058 [Pistacia vera]|uniref:uncharacterized protein LOC116120058 n=1 Tax=Pistacia vera TaxID=55513 RepID=UPI0012638A33|nr:uncharacterized protein LOC116120058 [Pistacia vera]
MEELGGHCFNGINNAIKKKRSQTSRRPRPDSQSFVESRDSTPPSDDMSKISSDENVGCGNKSKRKEFNLNQSVSGFSSGSGFEGEKPQKKAKREDGGFNIFYNSELGRSGHNNKRASEGVLAPANWRRNGESQSPGQLGGVNCDGLGNESKVKKVKLKVGGVTRTIQANSTANGVAGGGSSKNSQSPDDSRPRQKQNLQRHRTNPRRKIEKAMRGSPYPFVMAFLLRSHENFEDYLSGISEEMLRATLRHGVSCFRAIQRWI